MSKSLIYWPAGSAPGSESEPLIVIRPMAPRTVMRISQLYMPAMMEIRKILERFLKERKLTEKDYSAEGPPDPANPGRFLPNQHQIAFQNECGADCGMAFFKLPDSAKDEIERLIFENAYPYHDAAGQMCPGLPGQTLNVPGLLDLAFERMGPMGLNMMTATLASQLASAGGAENPTTGRGR